MADKLKIKRQMRVNRQKRVRAKISGTAKHPRLNVYRSLKHIFAQLIDDTVGKTIVSASDFEIKVKKGKPIDKAKEVGLLIAKKAQEKKISQAAFGKTIEEYKDFKKLKKENLRDHMDDLELIFTMLGEAATTKIAKSKEVYGLNENQIAARQGGEVAGNARKELEEKTGESVVTENNFLDEPEKIKRKKKKLIAKREIFV